MADLAPAHRAVLSYFRDGLVFVRGEAGLVCVLLSGSSAFCGKWAPDRNSKAIRAIRREGAGRGSASSSPTGTHLHLAASAGLPPEGI